MKRWRKHSLQNPEEIKLSGSVSVRPNDTPNIDLGLTNEQVEERTAQGLVNMVSDHASKSTGQIICSNIFTYFNMIFFLLAIILLYEGSYNNLTFLGVVFTNTVIGIVQEVKSKRALDKLKLISAPETTVIRNGRQERIPSEELVQDDIVIFDSGNQICADAIVCSGELTVNESLVTGESDEIKKASGDSLLSGSFVISGRATAQLTRVGDNSFAAQLSKSAKQIKKKQQAGMMKSLTRLIQVIGIILIPFAALMFWNQHEVLGFSEKVSVENMAASVIGMIPEGLYLLTSIALAASTIRLARKNTLVHDMKCIETLARVDVLCVDKTGTITEPEMQVEEFLSLQSESLAENKKRLGDFVSCMTADNETMKALQRYYEKQPGHPHASKVKGFSSATKYSAVDFGMEGAYLLGAPEFLLAEMEPELQAKVQEYSSQGKRVLLFALYAYEESGPEDIFSEGKIGQSINPLALIILSNPVRPQAKETFHYFKEQGVEIKVISGDNPLTASIAAQDAGIPRAENYIDTSALKDKKEISRAVSKYTVFGRVTPEQKQLLIRAMKKNGHTVAMTGDGVNDVLALKDADCSIAMASGSEAAANVSDLVLLDSDFSGMPHVVAEGRRVINNIERSASLFLVKNIFSFFLSLISLLSISLYPLKPAQISLVSALMIGIPSFFLALEPNHELVHGKFLRNVLFRAFPAALTAVILVEWSLLFADAFQIHAELASTVALFLYAFSSYVMLFRVCRPMNVWHGILFGAMGVLFLLAVWILPDWFHIVRLDYGCILILSTLLLLAVPMDAAIQHIFTATLRWKQKIQQKIRSTFSPHRNYGKD